MKVKPLRKYGIIVLFYEITVMAPNKSEAYNKFSRQGLNPSMPDIYEVKIPDLPLLRNAKARTGYKLPKNLLSVQE